MKAEFGHKRRIVEAMLAKRKIRTFWGEVLWYRSIRPFYSTCELMSLLGMRKNENHAVFTKNKTLLSSDSYFGCKRRARTCYFFVFQKNSYIKFSNCQHVGFEQKLQFIIMGVKKLHIIFHILYTFNIFVEVISIVSVPVT